MASSQAALAGDEVRVSQPFSFTETRFLALWAGIFLILLARRPDSIFNPQFLGEDGVIFYHDQLIYGFRALIFPYNGYLHLLPRLTALIESFAPAAIAPLVCCLFGTVLQAFAYSFVFRPDFRYLVRSDLLRAVSAIVIAMALDGNEMIGNSLNIQWHFILIGLILLFLPNSAGEGQSGKQLSSKAAAWLVVAAGFTASVLVILLPFSLWRMFTKSGREAVIALVFSFTLLIQFMVFLAMPRTDSPASLAGGIFLAAIHVAIAAVISWIYRTALTDLAGKDLAMAVAHDAHIWPFLAAAILLCAGLVWLAVRSTPANRRVLLIGFYVTAVSISLTLFSRNLTGQFQTMNGNILFFAPRYFVAAGYVLVFTIARALDDARFPVSGWAKGAALLLIFASGIRGNFATAPYVDYHWRDSAPAVQLWIDAHRHGGQAKHTEAPIVPAPWALSLPAAGES